MNKFYIIILAFISAFNTFALQTSNDSISGRPFKEFSKTAFCSYSSFHPSQYIVDNNWDILCSFRTPGTKSRLDSLNIPYNESQLKLLMVGDLLASDDGVYTTKMPILDKRQTTEIRTVSTNFADSVYPVIEPKIKELISTFKMKGYTAQTYSLIFSYLLDGYIWNEGKLPVPNNIGSHGTWSGVYWAMYDKRTNDSDGTNGYGPLKVNWTDDLGYWPSHKTLSDFGRCIMNNELPISDDELKTNLIKWNLVDSKGNPTIPVLKSGNGDEIDTLCNEITSQLSDAVKKYAPTIASAYKISSHDEASVIFYHEVMWDLLSLLTSNHLIEKPAILKGEEVGTSHFADISFITISDQ